MPCPPTGQTREIDSKQPRAVHAWQWLANGAWRVQGRSWQRVGFQFGAGQLRRPLAVSACAVWRNTGHVAPGTCISFRGRRGARFRAKLQLLRPAFQPSFFHRPHPPDPPFTRRSKAYRILLICSRSGANTIQRKRSLGRAVRFRSEERGRGRDRWRSAPRIWQRGLALGASG